MSFKDHFSKQAANYAAFRPRYPQDLFGYLAELCPARNLAWDCATGNGQAAIALAEHLDRVIATDASPEQIARAESHPRVTHRTAAAEQSGLPAATCDLVTVAQALHWFDLKAFYAETQRVLKQGGLLAVWNYQLLRVTPEIDSVVNHFYHEVVGPFWPPERKLIERGYSDLPFPFEEREGRSFQMVAQWSLEALLGYLRTWSASQRYEEAHDSDPVALIELKLRTAWNKGRDTRTISWPLDLRIGRHAS